MGSEIYSEAFFWRGGEFKKIFFMNHHSVLRMCMSSSENGCFLTSFFLLVLQLCMVSLSLFRTLLSLNCEDVMLQLVLRFVCASEHFAKCYTSKGLLHTSSHLVKVMTHSHHLSAVTTRRYRQGYFCPFLQKFYELPMAVSPISHTTVRSCQ